MLKATVIQESEKTFLCQRLFDLRINSPNASANRKKIGNIFYLDHPQELKKSQRFANNQHIIKKTFAQS